MHYFLIDSETHGHVFKSAVPTAEVKFSQGRKNLSAHLEKGNVLRSITDRAIIVTTSMTPLYSWSF